MMTPLPDDERPSMPSIAAIVKYWRAQNAPIAVGWDKAGERCWRCGQRLNRGTGEKHTEDDSYRHRAHIVPKSLGGPNEPSNIIILCRRCHALAPAVADPQFIWEWLRTRHAADPSMMLFRQAYIEYEILFGKFPAPEEFRPLFAIGTGGNTSLSLAPSGLSNERRKIFVERFIKAFDVAVGRFTGWHQGALSASTLAWAFRQAALYAEGKPSFVSALVPEPRKTAERDNDGPREQQRTMFDLLRDAEASPTGDGESFDEEKDRVSMLRATVGRYLPEFAKGVANAVAQGKHAEDITMVLHQDAFAAGYDDDEYTLLGMAVKYAGLYGVTVTVIGNNHETF